MARKIDMSPQTQAALDAVKAHVNGPAQAGGRQTYSDMLSQLWDMARSLAQQIALSDEPLSRKIKMLREYAALLPLLHKAEKGVLTSASDKAPEDMTDRELQEVIKALEAEKVRKARAKR